MPSKQKNKQKKLSLGKSPKLKVSQKGEKDHDFLDFPLPQDDLEFLNLGKIGNLMTLKLNDLSHQSDHHPYQPNQQSLLQTIL